MKLVYHRSSGKGPKKFVWEWRANVRNDPEQILWAVSKSTAELLASNVISRVKECANDREGAVARF